MTRTPRVVKLTVVTDFVCIHSNPPHSLSLTDLLDLCELLRRRARTPRCHLHLQRYFATTALFRVGARSVPAGESRDAHGK